MKREVHANERERDQSRQGKSRLTNPRRSGMIYFKKGWKTSKRHSQQKKEENKPLQVEKKTGRFLS